MSHTERSQQTLAEEALEAELLTIIDDGDVPAVLENFAAVRPLLPAAGLEHVVPFWETYGDVSRTVYAGFGTGKFRREEDVAKTLPIFFNQARKPLLAYVQGRPQHMAPEWRRSLCSPRVVRAAPGLQFLMHMNSHINNDLGRALDLSGVHEDYKHDYTIVVGDILEDVAQQRASEYIPLHTAGMRQFVLKSVLRYIAFAREMAWRDGKRLQASQSNETLHSMHVRRIERNAVAQGKLLLRTGDLALRSAIQAESLAGRRPKASHIV